SGASGHLGRAVVSELLQRPNGHQVVAITRTPETVSGPAQGRFGDYNRPESLAKAYAGLDRLLIITTIDPEPGKRGAQNVAAINAAVKAGVKHAPEPISCRAWGRQAGSTVRPHQGAEPP
ncbi:MAG TPA: NAD(P)H-binding protein, partial [Galbitalea sp.]|nr:NAD(P)H-binding protein [Galbitalea sp.]